MGQLIQFIQQHPDKPVQLELERESRKLSITLVPTPTTQTDGQVIGRIGVQLGGDPEMVTVSYGPIDSMINGVVKTFDTAWFS